MPTTINYQGRLTDGNGMPQPPSNKVMSIRVYDGETAGVQLYSESLGSISVDANGLYSFQFGAGPPAISGALATGSGHWLELTVEGAIQTPRQKIQAVPFAMIASTADDVKDGVITAAKLSSTAVTESLGSTGITIAAKVVRPDLINAGFSEVARMDATTVKFGSSASHNPPLSQTSEATPLWTGTELLVFGGRSSNTFPSTGGRYNPTNNFWTPMDSSGAPGGRGTYSAVWTGAKMIIWGGYDDTAYLSTGGIYDPSANANSWVPTNNADAPSARYNHAAFWTGSKMIVWGGQSTGVNPGGVFNDGALYDPSAGPTGTWTTMNTIGAPQKGNLRFSVWTGSEMIIFGISTDGLNTPYGGIYDPSTGPSGTWRTMDTTSAPVGGRAAVWTGDRMIVVGLVSSASFDPGSNYWTTLPAINGYNSLNTNPLQAVMAGTKILVWGNNEGYGASYDLTSSSWTRFLFNNSVYSPLTNAGTMIWANDQIIFYKDGSINLVRPGQLYHYSK